MKRNNLNFNKDDSFKMIIAALLLSSFVNISSIYDWAYQKSNSNVMLNFSTIFQKINDWVTLTKINQLPIYLQSTVGQYKEQKFYFGSTSNLNDKNDPISDNRPIFDSDSGSDSDFDSRIPLKVTESNKAYILNTYSNAYSFLNIFLSTNNKADVPFYKQNTSLNRYPSNFSTDKKQLSSISNSENNLSYLLLGDSILKSGVQMHLQSLIKSKNKNYTIDINSKSGTGLSRPDVYDWNQYLLNLKKTQNKNYQAIYVFLGTNDAQNLILDKKVIKFGTPDWQTEYSKRIQTFINSNCSLSKKTYWIGALKMRSVDFDSRLMVLNDIVKSLIQSAPQSCAEYVDVHDWFTQDLNFVEHWTLPGKDGEIKTVKIRADDGIHLSYWGSLLFSKKLIQRTSL